ncbi:MAG: NADH-quinone oxidoreductase subunit C [Bacteriovoracaceae bacterium]|nr:NADH-quinone oxidoreductase subunit C [Bacteriovoracaceae bacterium]
MLNELVSKINSAVSGANASLLTPEDSKLESSILVDAKKIHAVAEFLKKSKIMNALQAISGVDYVEFIEVVYIFGNFDIANPGQLLLKARITDRVNGNIDTISDLFPAADYQERECFDMLGITFNNHPDHRRILCPDDWEGFPLRKDYVAAKNYNGMEVFPEGKMNMADREFIVRQEMIKKAQEAQSGKVQ